MRTRTTRRRLGLLAAVVCLAAAGPLAAQLAQVADPDAQARRLGERIERLQQEAEQLAAQSKSLVGDLRRLEVERDLAAARLAQAQNAAETARAGVAAATRRLEALEAERVARLPNLEAQLVDVYKRGRGGYARLLLQSENLRDLGRTARAVSALVTINRARVEAHRATVDAQRRERDTLGARAAELTAAESEARQSQATAARAATARLRLIEEIDERRDLTAQLAGELQVAHDRLLQQVADLAASRQPPREQDAVAPPPLQGTLLWPVDGPLLAPFGATRRPDGSAGRDGIEIAAIAGEPVRAAHGGTVTWAAPFTGFGTLVILDHGGNSHSLYGYLTGSTVQQGARVEAGAEIGTVGLAPAGPPALYFELLVDGRSVDPVQWLKPR